MRSTKGSRCPEVDANVEVSERTVPCALLSLLDLAYVHCGDAVVSSLASTSAEPVRRRHRCWCTPRRLRPWCRWACRQIAALGDKVKFVSLTNSDAGHQTQHGEELANRRRAEAREAGRRIGIEYDVLDNHDGKLFPTLEVREQVIRLIRIWKADIV